MKTIFLFSIFTLVSIVTIIFYFKQKKNSAEANRLRLMVSNIIDAMPSMLIGVDGKLTVTQWNKEAEKRTGLTAKNVIDKPVDIVYPELTSEIQQIRTAIEKQQIHNIRQRARKTAEGLFYDDLTIFPLKIGSVQGAVIRIDDQTHQVQMNEMVVQSEKMRSVGGLAAGMAHEINNPLGIIMGLTQSISRRFSADLKPNKTVAGEIGLDLDKVQRYMKRREITVYLDGIKDAGLRAAKIVRDMLDFSRQSESIPSQCNIHVILDKAVELASSDYDLKKQFDFRSIIIERDYAEDLPIIDVVETEIEQVFLNLLKNAAQAQSEKQYIDASPKIILRTGFNADKIRIEIEDNGPGMSLDMTKRIFDPFFTTKEVGQGTGLGLSVSYFIITNTHNGSFTVESVENRGSKIIIQLPVREGAGK